MSSTPTFAAGQLFDGFRLVADARFVRADGYYRPQADILPERQHLMRSFLIAGILALLVLPAMSAETLETDTFRLEMKGDWKKGPSSDAEQFALTSRKNDVGVTVSTMKFKESGVDLERMTRKLQEFRLSGEESASRRFNRKMEIAEPLVTKADRGWHLQYFGKDNTGRKFRYFGIVVPGKLMNIYAESSSASFEQLDEVLQEIFKGLQF